MTKYQKIFSFVFVGFIVLFFILLIYARTISDDAHLIKERLQTVTPDSLAQILITPKNPEWNINLTLDTIRIQDKAIISEITDYLNNMNENYPGRGLPQTWEANLILDYKKNNDIKLEVVDSFEGICVSFTNTMGNPKFRCNGLKTTFEDLANYTENLGKRK